MLNIAEKYTFKTYDSHYLSKNGMTVTILRPVAEYEIALVEVGQMYEVELEDGTTLQAFEDELIKE
jgi:hypothetical protein